MTRTQRKQKKVDSMSPSEGDAEKTNLQIQNSSAILHGQVHIEDVPEGDESDIAGKSGDLEAENDDYDGDDSDNNEDVSNSWKYARATSLRKLKLKPRRRSYILFLKE